MPVATLPDLSLKYIERWKDRLDARSSALLIRNASRFAFLYEIVRYCSTERRLTEAQRKHATRMLQIQDRHREEVLNIPPGMDLELTLLRWHVELTEYVIGAMWPGYCKVRETSDLQSAKGKKRRKDRPRELAAQYKRSGYSKAEASATLKRALPNRRKHSVRLLTKAVAEVYGIRTRKN